MRSILANDGLLSLYPLNCNIIKKREKNHINLNTKNMVDDSSPLSKAGGSKEWCFLWFLLHYISVSVHRILKRAAWIDILFVVLFWFMDCSMKERIYTKQIFCPITLCNLYYPENWAKSSGREVRRNSPFPSAPQNHMNWNINETFMNHT